MCLASAGEILHDLPEFLQEKALIVLQNLTKRGSLEDLERWSACEIYSVAVETLRDCTELSTASCDAGLYVVANLAPKGKTHKSTRTAWSSASHSVVLETGCMGCALAVKQ